MVWVMLIESIAVSAIGPVRVAYAGNEIGEKSECDEAATPAAGNDFNQCMPISKADRKAVNAVIAQCGTNASCYPPKIAQASSAALGRLRTALSATSGDMRFVIGQYCEGVGAGLGSASQFLASVKCTNSALATMREDAAEAVGKKGFTQEAFKKFLGEQVGKSAHDQNWSYLLFNQDCPGDKATLACYRQHVGQIARDAAVAAPAYTAYAGQIYRAAIINGVHGYCQADAEACKTAFKTSKVVLAMDDPTRPKYFPRVPPPPTPAQGGGGAAGTGGSGTQGTGTGGGGTDARTVAGPGHGLSATAGAGTGDGTPPPPPPPRGAKGGVKGGTQDCGKDVDGKPIDCNALSLIPISDPSWEVEGPVAHCPDFIAERNCLSTGSGLAGDLANIRNAPYFAASRERMCRDRIKNLFGSGSISRQWADPSQATLGASPGCDYWMHQLHMPDPVPPLTREEIDLGRVGADGAIAESIKNASDLVTHEGVERDLGAYSLEQKAIALFEVKANLYPGILVDADPSQFNAEITALEGAASCLNTQDKATLKTQLQNMRDIGLSHSQLLNAQKDNLDKQWVEALTAQANKVVAQDRTKFDLAHLWGRMRCDGASLGDPSQCMKVDYKTIATQGATVSPGVYASRIRWIREDLAAAIAPEGIEKDSRYDSILRPGSGASEDPNCTYVSCSGLHGALSDVRKQQDAIVSGDPLLEEETGRTEQRPECGSDPAERNVGAVRWEAVTSIFHTPYEESTCQRKQTLADVLHATASPLARLAYAHNAAAQMHQEGLKKVAAVCGKKDGIYEEGKHASAVHPLAAGFLNCQDVGEYSKTCENRRSYGPFMCRMYVQNAADENTRQFHEMFQGMAMAAGGALAILATAGGAALVAGAVGIGMSTTSIVMRHQEINASAANYDTARSDFIAKLGDRDATRAAWSRMTDAQRYAIAGDIFDAATAALDVHAIAGALKTASTATTIARQTARVAMVDQMIQDGKDLDALAHASKLRGAEQTLAEIEKIGGAEAKAELLADMRGGLRRYGPIVDSMPEAELATLQNLESRVRVLAREGLLDEQAVGRIRRQISDALISPEKLNQLAGHEIADLYHEMQASGRFAGTAGRAAQDRFVEVFEGMLRQQHPELTEEMWRAMSRDEKLAVLEGRMSPADALAHHPSLAKKAVATAEAKGASGPISEARGSHPSLTGESRAATINASEAVTKYRERYKVFSEVNDADNARYIALANSPNGVGRLYFEAENAVLKQLNDSVIANKDTVTAMTNQFKEMLLDKINKNPILRGQVMGSYSDFKSIRFALRENTEAIAKLMETAYKDAAQEFEAAMADSPLKELYGKSRGISGSPGSWHLAGIGSTADEASVAARSARPYFKAGQSLSPMRSFAASTGMLADRLAVIEDMRAEIQSGFYRRGSAMFAEAVPGSSKYVLSEDAFDIMRKVKVDPKAGLEGFYKEIRERFSTRFGIDKNLLTNDVLANIREYVTFVDGNTASIITSQRVVIEMARAERAGVMSFDLAGAGAANLERTAGELAADAARTPSSAVVGARKAEGVVTEVMRKKLIAIREAVRDVLGDEALTPSASPGAHKTIDPFSVTGDDVCYFPKRTLTQGEREAIQARTTRRLEDLGYSPDRVRTTYQPPKMASGAVIPSGARSTYVVAAEKVEKSLRTALETPGQFERLKKVGIMVDYTPGVKGSGTMKIFLTGHVDAKMLEAVRAQAVGLIPDGVKLEGVTVAPGSSI